MAHSGFMMTFFQSNKKLYIFTILWFLMLMFLSHQPGPDTAKTSGSIAEFIVWVISSTIGVSVQVELVHEFIRHMDHIVLYVVLAVCMGILMRRACRSWIRAILLLVLIAIADEGTKPLIAGRHCELIDICRNCVGNVVGLGIVYISELSKASTLRN